MDSLDKILAGMKLMQEGCNEVTSCNGCSAHELCLLKLIQFPPANWFLWTKEKEG